MARFLHVFLKGKLVGQLEQDRAGAVRFAYDHAWLEQPSAASLSRSLPLRKERFGWKECRPFFAGLLPEEDSRQLIAKALGVSEKNDFAILERIGAECAGAISLMRPGEAPPDETPRYRAITREELAAKFGELPRRPLLIGEEGIRLSLAGAQGKLAVRIHRGDISLPLDGSPSSHILKPQSSRFDHLVENEFFCMRLAAQAGLEVAAVEIGEAGGIPFLQIERFDRHRLPDGSLERIHQEDFCQALGVPPEFKYQDEGGPNLKRCFELVRATTTVPGPDVLKLFDATIFNFLIGNCDAHGKNFSFLYDEGGARLAPLYDLVCTQAYPHLSAKMAMKIGNEREPARVAARNWQKFFAEASLGQAAAEQRLKDLVLRVEQETMTMVAKEVAGARDVSSVVLANCKRLYLPKPSRVS